MEYKNYLFELYANFPVDFSLENRKEPEEISKDLYDDLKQVFFNLEARKELQLGNIENKCQNFGKGYFYTLFINKGKTQHLLSADYIGVSIHWAKEAGLSETERIDFLKISRTLGGHIVFPRGGKYPTLNQARGGEPQTKKGKYQGYYDRFDLTLYALKKWFSKEDSSRLNYVIENYKDWFELFYIGDETQNGFKKFISFFNLDGFVSDNLDIIDLVKSDLENNVIIYLENEDIDIPKTKNDYIKYIRNSNKIILNRTECLTNQLLLMKNEGNRNEGKN